MFCDYCEGLGSINSYKTIIYHLLAKNREAKDLIPGVHLGKLNPLNWKSSIPFYGLLSTILGEYDNNYVMVSRMPDGKTGIALTDTSHILELDLNTLK